MKRILLSFGIAVFGVAFHMFALAAADRLVADFPSVTDVFMERLPYWNLYGIGEVVFWVFLALFAFTFFRERPRDLPFVLTLIGLFYGIRGLFLLLLPIGAPVGAPALDERFVLYPYAGHAFFPGGHVGLLFLFSLLVQNRGARVLFILLAVLFGIGSVIARAHYTADLLGAFLLSYTLVALGSRHLLSHFRIPEKGALR
jgi:hypothetical protein